MKTESAARGRIFSPALHTFTRVVIAECDENLCRAELSPADRAIFTARRKALYEALHPETRQHVAGGHAKHETASDNLSFAASTAVATGKDERTIQRDAERGEKVSPEAMDLVRGTKLDTGRIQTGQGAPVVIADSGLGMPASARIQQGGRGGQGTPDFKWRMRDGDSVRVPRRTGAGYCCGLD